MNGMAEKVVSWTRIDRIGMLAMTLGFEFSVYNALLFSFVYIDMLLDLNEVVATVVSLATCMGIAYGFGHFLNGGIAIRLLNLSLRKFKDSSCRAAMALRLEERCGLVTVELGRNQLVVCLVSSISNRSDGFAN